MVKSAGSYSGTSGNGVGETPGTDRSPRGRNRWARCIRHHGFAGRIRNTGCNEHDTHNDHCCKHQQNADGQFLLQITKYTPDILLKDMLFFPGGVKRKIPDSSGSKSIYLLISHVEREESWAIFLVI